MRGWRDGQRHHHRAARLSAAGPIDFWFAFKALVALAAVLVLYWTGAAVVRMFASVPPPEESPDVQAVDLRFECVVCGALVTMTAAPDAEPQPPRHCMEEMRLVSDHSSN